MALNAIFDTGVLVFNSCESLERMLIKNAKVIDKSDDIARLLNGYGGTSFVFRANSKGQASIKKYFRTTYKDENVPLLEKILRKVVLGKLEKIQAKVKEDKKLVYFNLTEEITDTIGTFVLKMIFGDANIDLDETVRIYIDGVEKSMPFSVAFRATFS